VLKPRDDGLRASQHSGAVRTKLGEALRERYDLMEPLPHGIGVLLGQLDAVAHARDVGQARLHAELEEGIEAMAHAANRKLDGRKNL